VTWKKHASTLVLVVVAGLLAVGFALDRKSVSDAERRERDTDVFPAYRRQDVSRIELAQGSVKTVIERRSEGDAGETVWWMTSPRDERADAASVDKLLGDIEFAGIVRKVDPKIPAGVETPRMTGTLSMGPLLYRFALGGDAPTPQGDGYFRVDGEGSFVVSKDFVASLLKGSDAYRERTIVPYLSLQLQRLAVKGRGASFAIERIYDVSFRLPDLGLRASRETLDRVWGALAEARAESFLQDEDADRALGPDPLVIDMKPRDASKKDGELLVGGECPGRPEAAVVIRRSPTRGCACVPKGMIPGLLVTSAELVDKRLFVARGDEVAELVLERVPDGEKVELARKATGWHERAPIDRDLGSDETDAANDLAAALAKGEGTDIVAGDPKAPFAARARVRIERGENKGEEIVLLGPKLPAGGALVRRDADGATMRVSEALAHRLMPSEIAFRSRQVFGSSLEGKIAKTLSTECDGNKQSVARGDGGWSFESPAGFKADTAMVLDLVNVVARAKADAWIADSDDGSFGFANGGCDITLSYEQDGGPRQVGVVFGREAEGGGYYAHALGEAPVFLAPRSLHDEAARLLVDRTGFHVDSAEVASLTLARDGAELVLTGRGGRLGWKDGGGLELGEKLAVSLDAMRADEVVHLGGPRRGEGFAHPSLDVRVQIASEAGTKELHFVIGDSALILKERMFYARLDGVDATFAIARDRVAPLLDAL
jgi:hypothetical protein